MRKGLLLLLVVCLPFAAKADGLDGLKYLVLPYMVLASLVVLLVQYFIFNLSKGKHWFVKLFSILFAFASIVWSVTAFAITSEFWFEKLTRTGWILHLIGQAMKLGVTLVAICMFLNILATDQRFKP
jgi:hypothetical protein